MEPPAKRPKLQEVTSGSDSDSSEDERQAAAYRKQASRSLYLETVNRRALDFDSDKICSVSLANANIYGCLVCGKYFRGRSRNSECFSHSINENHHLFISFDTLKFYVLPENYELDQKASDGLNDIRMAVNPPYSAKEVSVLDTDSSSAISTDGKSYDPGFVGMVNFGANDYVNAVIQCLVHVSSLRNKLIRDYKDLEATELTRRVALLAKKMWSRHLLRPYVSAHELIQYVTGKSEFAVDKRSPVRDFLMWILNHLHKELVSEVDSKIIAKTFQGKLELKSGKHQKFWVVPLTLPQVSLFEGGEAETPQVDLAQLLKPLKFVKVAEILVIGINRTDSAKKLQGVTNSDLNPTVVMFDPDSLLVKGHRYRLVANVVYDTDVGADGKQEMASTESELHYKVQLLSKAKKEWTEIRDLKCKPVDKSLLFLSHSTLQFWERVN